MIGIRKPGQGYWVRVFSVVFWAALVVGGGLYAWAQAELIPIRVVAYEYASPAIDETLAVGDVVTLVRLDAEGQDDAVGTAVVESFQRNATGQGAVTIGSLNDIGSRELGVEILASEAVRLVEGTLASPESTTLITEASGRPMTAYPVQYQQAAAAGVVLLFGEILLLWTHGSMPKTTDFLIATDGEMRKVHWSTRKEIQGSTVVVIVATFLIAAFLYAFDSLFSFIFRSADVLQS